MAETGPKTRSGARAADGPPLTESDLARMAEAARPPDASFIAAPSRAGVVRADGWSGSASFRFGFFAALGWMTASLMVALLVWLILALLGISLLYFAHH